MEAIKIIKFFLEMEENKKILMIFPNEEALEKKFFRCAEIIKIQKLNLIVNFTKKQIIEKCFRKRMFFKTLNNTNIQELRGIEFDKTFDEAGSISEKALSILKSRIKNKEVKNGAKTKNKNK